MNSLRKASTELINAAYRLGQHDMRERCANACAPNVVKLTNEHQQYQDIIKSMELLDYR